MNIETERIIIRSIQRGDEKAYAEMAKDGSLAEMGLDFLDIENHQEK